MRRLPLSLLLVGAGAVATACEGPAPLRGQTTTPPARMYAAPRVAAQPLPPPAFTDPDRPAKLAALVPKLGARVDEFFAVEAPPSLAVAMVVDGQVVMTRLLGARDRRAGAAAPTPHTLYRIGSITKTFTAETVLALRDAGVLRLDEPAETYLPDLASVVYPYADAPRVTLRHLLSHTSGLPRLGDFDYTRPDRDVTEAEVVGAVRDARLVTAPGTAYEYSNFGVGLVGVLVGRVAPERSLREALRGRLLAPLGMASTTFEPPPEAERAVGFVKRTDEKPAKPWRLGASEAAGGLWSSLEDMSRWVAFQLDAWPPRPDADPGPLSRASRRESHVATFPHPLSARVEDGHLHATASSVGLVWETTQSCRYERVVGHAGAVDGFHADIGFAPERGFGFVVLASSIDTDTGRLIHLLFEDAEVLEPRRTVAAPELIALVTSLTSPDACTDLAWRTTFARSFQSAVPSARYGALCDDLAKTHGACRLAPGGRLASATSGTFALACDRGRIEAEATMTFERGAPRLSGLFVRSQGLPLPADLIAAAEAVLRLEARWDATAFAATFASRGGAAEQRVGDAFARVRDAHGACTIAAAKPPDSDGQRTARVPLSCEKGPPIALDIALADERRVTSAVFRSLDEGRAEGRCVTDPQR